MVRLLWLARGQLEQDLVATGWLHVAQGAAGSGRFLQSPVQCNGTDLAAVQEHNAREQHQGASKLLQLAWGHSVARGWLQVSRGPGIHTGF